MRFFYCITLIAAVFFSTILSFQLSGDESKQLKCIEIVNQPFDNCSKSKILPPLQMYKIDEDSNPSDEYKKSQDDINKAIQEATNGECSCPGKNKNISRDDIKAKNGPEKHSSDDDKNTKPKSNENLDGNDDLPSNQKSKELGGGLHPKNKNDQNSGKQNNKNPKNNNIDESKNSGMKGKSNKCNEKDDESTNKKPKQNKSKPKDQVHRDNDKEFDDESDNKKSKNDKADKPETSKSNDESSKEDCDEDEYSNDDPTNKKSDTGKPKKSRSKNNKSKKQPPSNEEDCEDQSDLAKS